MNFSFLSKQNLGVALFLLFILIISESHILNFFFNNSLGRAIFIFCLLSIAYLNNILGVISVLMAILLINSKENGWLEGFTGEPPTTTGDPLTNTGEPTSATTTSGEPTTTSTDESTTTSSDETTTTTNNSPPYKDASGNDLPSQVTTSDSNTTTTTSNNVLNKEIDKVQKSIENTSDNSAFEGFDILGMENNLKRGKKSNSIPISNQTRKSENVDPYYQSSFGNSFSYF